MIAHKTFSRVHFFSAGKGLAKVREELRVEVEAFINREIKDEDIINVSEAADQYASSATVWYQKR